MAVAIELRGASKAYDGVPALAPTDLAVAGGERCVLIGPSGCGKSTLLRLVNGLVAPDAGVVLVDGEPLVPARAPELRRRMGYVIQEGGLFPHLTAEDNVTLVARWQNRPADAIAARVRELRELVRLPAELLARFPSELSGGQRQRVSLMRALMLDPQLLLLDEPLGALDPMVRAELQADLLAVVRTLGKTLLMVTHDLGEAARFGERLVLMRAGRVVQMGTLDQLERAPAEEFVTDFLAAQHSLWGWE